MDKIIKCTDCGRQIVSYPADDKVKVGGYPATHGVGNNFICYKCAKDLDENGLYPEERQDG
jgi:hypothetical protein